ncbi:hypothetical protein CkaCkLH20_01785 [Colletotrichum karsti]|uniref:Uncharacterized protein n=1 Tax=Colletotrichum karsti TaxID=1095194 RepID=A0A9P6IDB2_9PEZI|nr:uncharacterized protein CkaCkLH20_01785 [Colletotrichum karsti]KAF9880743.1 hypothetical protein CkaCkLH20_01785 [Colletotrichum karsti]
MRTHPSSPLVLAFVLLLLAASATSREQDDGDQPVQHPPPADTSDAQLSWPSAFWALVAVALSTALQPSGRIVGFPSSWSPALKFSPVFCIINTVEALRCIGIRRNPEWTLVVAPYKYDTDADPAHSDVGALQRNTLLRVIAFVLGPLLQATKLYACRGIFWIQLLATIYLASFLCDEVTLCLLWLTGSTQGRNSVTGLVEAISGSIRSPPPSAFAAFGHDMTGDARPTTQQEFALFVSYMFINWFVLTVITGIGIKEPVIVDIVEFLIFLGLYASAVACGIISRRKGNTTDRIFWDAICGASVPFLIHSNISLLHKNCTPMAIILGNGLIDFHGKPTSKAWMWKLVCWASIFTCALMARSIYPVDRHMIPKPTWLFLSLWAITHMGTGLLMLKFSHDPAQSYKPAWTDFLG